MTSSGASHSDDWDRTRPGHPRIWGDVPPRNPDFTGQRALLGLLHSRLMVATRKLPQALHGMGGVGKTQIAVEYIHRHENDYDLVWWVPAENVTDIRASFADLAKRLDISEKNEEAAIAAVLRELNSGSRGLSWILVFDNAVSPDVVQPFVPTRGGHILVTSRSAGWGHLARETEVERDPATGRNGRRDGTYVICVFDLENFGARDRTRENRMAIRQGMHGVVEPAFARAGIPWQSSHRRDTGDGIIVAVPAAGTDKGAFVGELPNALSELLDEHNKANPDDVVRLRLALDVSELAFDSLGPEGRGFIHANRLVDAAPLKSAQARSAKPLAVITSEYVYDEVVKQHSRYAPDEYRKVAVQVKETDAFGWIRIPGDQLPAMEEATSLWGQILRAVRDFFGSKGRS